VLSPFPSLFSSLLTRPKLESSVRGASLQVPSYWQPVRVQGQGERDHRPVQAFLSRKLEEGLLKYCSLNLLFDKVLCFQPNDYLQENWLLSLEINSISQKTRLS